MKQRLVIVSLLVVLLLLPACPVFENPLPEPKEMKADPALLGTWVSVEEEGESNSQILFFGRESGWIDFIFIDGVDGTSSSDGVDVSTFEAYSTVVDGKTFLSMRPRKKDLKEQEKEETGYLLAHYHFSEDGVLLLIPFDKAAVKKLIVQEKLKGVITKAKYDDSVLVTASPEELAAAITEHGVDAFIAKADVLKFTKLKQ